MVEIIFNLDDYLTFIYSEACSAIFPCTYTQLCQTFVDLVHKAHTIWFLKHA